MSEWTEERIREVAAVAVEKAKTDEAFRESLIANPHAAIHAATGQAIPESIKLTVGKQGADELSEAELEQVAGGGGSVDIGGNGIHIHWD